VHDSGPALRTKAEPAFLEHLQHCSVVWQNLCDEFPKARTTGDRSNVVHQRRADTLSLVLVNDSESHLSLPRVDDDITPAADDHWPLPFFHHCDQGYLISEVNV
jgi:hypothetical protein